MNLLKDNKCDLSVHNALKESMERRVMELENTSDQLKNNTLELQNFTDIYMPLRIQHQITETVKNCLPK